MHTAVVFLNNRVNWPLTEGHFVIIDNKSDDLLWLQSAEAAKIQIFNDDVPINLRLSCIIGRIQGRSEILGRTRVEFFLPIKEFLPDNVNSRMSINSGPCAAIKELIKTQFVGCVKNADIADMAFVFMPPFIENGTHAVVFGMTNVFICRYEFQSANKIHEEIPFFAICCSRIV